MKFQVLKIPLGQKDFCPAKTRKTKVRARHENPAMVKKEEALQLTYCSMAGSVVKRFYDFFHFTQERLFCTGKMSAALLKITMKGPYSALHHNGLVLRVSY